MKVEVYILANNEEIMMPYIMRHYSQFAEVTILENNSTDKTIEIVHSLGARIFKYNVPDEINDQWYIEVKGNCWKGSMADWVIIADADEFVYHPDIINILKKTDATIIRPRLYNMYSKVFPTTKGQIYEEVKFGIEGGGKTNLFRPSEIQEINYLPGCHNARPTGNVLWDRNSGILTLHMRNLSKQWLIERSKRASQRLSAINKAHNWGSHYNWSEDMINNNFDKEFPQVIKVI
jgi:glycosyltransferase involved in cell wall biosynthesis